MAEQPRDATTGHTPLPWEVCGASDSGWRILACDDRRTIVCEVPGGYSNPTTKADAYFLHRAARHHDALVAALRSLMNEASGALHLEWGVLVEALGQTNVNCLQRRVDEARAVLAAVEQD